MKDGIDIPADEDRCPLRCPRSTVRCMRKKGHKTDDTHSKCMFTTKSMMSASTCRKVLNTIMGGTVKELAGLDEEDVVKGTWNFASLKGLALRLCQNLSKGKEDTDNLLKMIDDSLVFHKTLFKTHLKIEAEHICHCLCCGLTDENEKHSGDHMGCKLCETDQHKPSPCLDCENTFEIFTILNKYVDEALSIPNLSPQEIDDYVDIRICLPLRREHVIHWRSHIARKQVEADYDREQIQHLAPNEAVVICDWKMKILACKLQETMPEFYGKRGTSCLGFMSITNVDQEKNEMDVHFHLLFTDDCTQDANSVLSAKAWLYNTYLPSVFTDSCALSC